MRSAFESNNEYELGEFNDFSLNPDTTNIAQELFIEQVNEGLVIEGEYDSLGWKFISKNRYVSVFVNFKDIYDHTYFRNMNSELIVIALKNWFLTQVPHRSVESLKKYLDYLKEFLIISNYFNTEHVEDVRMYLQLECDDSRKWNLCIPALNFLDFIDELDQNKEYRKMLVEMKKDINIENVSGKVRNLPKANDIFTFSFTLEEFIFNTPIGTPVYFKYFPVYIWWVLSNIIPMRPSEFCAIERTSLCEEQGNYFITLPRIKQRKNTHKIQVVDKILITKEIFTMLSEYVKATEKFGSCITLISPKSFKSVQHSYYKKDRFTLSDLQQLIYSFYKEVIEEKYHYHYQQKLSPGDTRHFAFLNLMRQGYHPVEIARLGGHTSLQAQYHYQQHLEYWVDVEIVQLMQRTNIMPNKYSNILTGFSLIDNDFIYEKVLMSEESNFMSELEIGYCTDPNMFCQTDKHFFCPAWKISYDEFLLKKNEIMEVLKSCKTDVDRITATLKNLFSVALNESLNEADTSEQSSEFNKDLFYTKNQLDTALHKFATLSKKIRMEK